MGRSHSTRQVWQWEGAGQVPRLAMELIMWDIEGLCWGQSKLNWVLISLCEWYVIRVLQNIYWTC